MMEVKISVIVPIYNAEKTIRKSLDSILCQTFKDFELLLIDDGSNDKSPEICDEYANKDNRIIVIHKKNGGVSSARNVALDLAKGNWITFIDSDDFISADFFVGIEDSGVDIVIKRCREFECGIERECKPTISYGLFVEKNPLCLFWKDTYPHIYYEVLGRNSIVGILLEIFDFLKI
jgi:glycosyltransferase involved in cell wall biosynthesis